MVKLILAFEGCWRVIVRHAGELLSTFQEQWQFVSGVHKIWGPGHTALSEEEYVRLFALQWLGIEGNTKPLNHGREVASVKQVPTLKLRIATCLFAQYRSKCTEVVGPKTSLQNRAPLVPIKRAEDELV